MVQRRIPQPRDLAPLLQFKKPELDGRKRRLAAAYTIDDLRRIAKRRTPKAPFDYTDGAAEGELSLARARQAFRDKIGRASCRERVEVSEGAGAGEKHKGSMGGRRDG